MGGYAQFVWPSYGFAVLVLAGMWVLAWRSMRQREAEVERLRSLGADPRRRVRADPTAATRTAPAGEGERG